MPNPASHIHFAVIYFPLVEKEACMPTDDEELIEHPVLDGPALFKSLLQFNYFPRTHDQKEEMPPIFNSEQFTPEIANKVINIALDDHRKFGGYDIMPFRRTRHPNVPRNMGIPHPRAYAELAKCLADNWDANLKSICQSENSDLSFGLQPPPDNRILVHNYDIPRLREHPR
jgi:hypothetical protein